VTGETKFGLRSVFLMLLAVLTAASIFWSAALIHLLLTRAEGFLIGPTAPLGADFINLWTAALMVLQGKTREIYDWQLFNAFQQSFLNAYIGHRLWAYPPHSLLFVWPFGLLGFVPALIAWSVLGLVVMVAGARRFGLSWCEAIVLVGSPAALESLINGQSGNLACGLLLASLASMRKPVGATALSAAILTVKPQLGLLLPVIWLKDRRWTLIALTSGLTLLFFLASAALFGPDSWRLYLSSTLPELSNLQRTGKGAYMEMIPSFFMSARLLGFEGDSAFRLHLLIAVPILIFAIWRILVEEDRFRRAAIAIAATCLVSPYLHTYDLTLLVAMALILMRRTDWGIAAMVIAWPLPLVMEPLAKSGWPIAPLFVLALLALACIPASKTSARVAAQDA